tara:strand:+ start:2250 stop:2438 length:189 start_codon:yes stop_codon:yes gene_type:complete
MPGNGGFPPIKIIKKDKNEKIEKRDRFFKQKKNIVNISQILESVKKPMIDLNKEKINIIDSL